MRLILLICMLMLTSCVAEESAEITPQDVISQMESSNVMILDVRNPREFDSGHIPGAVLLPLARLEAEVKNFIPDLDQVIYVYCQTGRRSRNAQSILKKMGFTAVYDLGGIVDWTGEIVRP